MTIPLRTAVIGLEHYHVTGWVETLGLFPEQIELVARYDPDPQRAARERPSFVDPSLPQRFPDAFIQVPFFSDLGQMISEIQPELAMVALPNRLAPDAIVELAQAGCHLLVDKPGALTAADADRSVIAARSNGVKMAVAFTRRYGLPWRRVAQEIAGGRLGRLLTSEAIFVTSSVPVREPRNLIFDRAAMGGGILHWLGIHDIDLLQWLAGEPIVTVHAMTATMSSAEIEVEDTISMSFWLAGGSIGTMHFAYALPRPGGEGYLALRGSRASVCIAANGATEWIGPGCVSDPLRSETIASETARLPGYGAAGASIVADLLDAIANDRDPLATGEHARDALRVINAAYASAASGEVVEIRQVASAGETYL
jgi:UDP-N-acetyl-2-amino-2-deoxyglucuronate dehydrogenase